MIRNRIIGSCLVGLYLASVPVFSYISEELDIIPQMIGAVLTLYAFALIVNSRTIIINFAIRLYLLYTLWSLITFVFAENQSQISSLFTLIKVAIITLSIAIILRTSLDYILTLSIFFSSIFLVLFLNYNEFVLTMGQDGIIQSSRFAGTFASPNTAALYCLGVIWAGFTLLIFRHSSYLFKAFLLFGIFISIVIIIYSGSRKGVFGLIFISLVIGWISMKRFGSSDLRKFITFGVVILLLILVFYKIYTSPFFERITTMNKGEYSAINRMYLFKEAIILWKSSFKNILIGIGYDNFKFFNNLNEYSHSSITETLVCTGFIGFLLYYMSLFGLLISFYRLYKTQDPKFRLNILLIIGFLVLIMFFNSFAVLIQDRLFWPLLAVVSSYKGILISSPESIKTNKILT